MEIVDVEIITDDLFAQVDCLLRHVTDFMVCIEEVLLPNTHIRFNILRIGNRDSICIGLFANNRTHFGERIAVSFTKMRQGFIGDIECQFRL